MSDRIQTDHMWSINLGDVDPTLLRLPSTTGIETRIIPEARAWEPGFELDHVSLVAPGSEAPFLPKDSQGPKSYVALPVAGANGDYLPGQD